MQTVREAGAIVCALVVLASSGGMAVLTFLTLLQHWYLPVIGFVAMLIGCTLSYRTSLRLFSYRA